jgi:hypothetical protein
MLQIVYISTAKINLSRAEVEVMLTRARARNLQNDVTGLIFFNGQRFLQALEGEEAVVRRTYARIAANPNHFAMVLLSERQIDRREFGPWAMTGYIVANHLDEAEIIADVDRLVADVPDPNIREQFRSFARIKRAA